MLDNKNTLTKAAGEGKLVIPHTTDSLRVRLDPRFWERQTTISAKANTDPFRLFRFVQNFEKSLASEYVSQKMAVFVSYIFGFCCDFSDKYQ